MTVIANRQQRRALEAQNRAWPDRLVSVPRDAWPSDGDLNRTAVFRSRRFLVQVFDEGEGFTRLSVNRTEIDPTIGRWSENISWDDLQSIKNECGFVDHDAVEVFPRQQDVVNVANMRHLWVLPQPFPRAWRVV